MVFFFFPPKEFFLISSMFFVYPSANLLSMTKGVLLSLRHETFHSQREWRVAREGQWPKPMYLKPHPGWPGQVPIKQSAGQPRVFAQLGSVWGQHGWGRGTQKCQPLTSNIVPKKP